MPTEDPVAVKKVAIPAKKIIIPDLEQVEVQYRHQYESGIWAEDPARVTFTALASKRLGQLSMGEDLGTETPDKLLVLTDKHNLYFVAAPDHPQAVEVSWNEGRAYVNLIKIFTYLRRVLPPGSRHFYRAEFHDQPVDIGDGKEHKALKVPLKRVKPRKESRASAPKGGSTAKADAAPAAEKKLDEDNTAQE